MKHYYDIETKSFFTIENFEYTPKSTEIEISSANYDEFQSKIKLGYNYTIDVINGQVAFSYQFDEAKLLKAKQNKLRQKRKPLLEAFDRWEKAVLRGRATDDEAVMNWYQALLDLEESAFENIPIAVQYYI